MRMFIKINDLQDTTFTSDKGRYTKTYINNDELYVTRNYKTEEGMLRAVKRVFNSESYVITYNSNGVGTRDNKINN